MKLCRIVKEFGDAGDRVSCVARLQFRVVSSGGIEEALSGGWSHRRDGGIEASEGKVCNILLSNSLQVSHIKPNISRGRF